MIRVAVCDDVFEYLDAAIKLLELYQSENTAVKMEISVFDSPASLLECVEADNSFDIYLLDIIMPEINGIILAQKIRSYDENAALIFFTASADYALEAFGVSAVQYILEPIDKNRLFPVLDKIIASLLQEDNSFILVCASDGSTVKTQYSSIIIVEQIKRVLRFHLNNGEVLESKMIRVPFNEAVAQLFRDKRFLHVHQSFVINMAHVHKLCPQSFLMKNGVTIPIPKPKYSNVKNIYFEYISQSNSGKGWGLDV